MRKQVKRRVFYGVFTSKKTALLTGKIVILIIFSIMTACSNYSTRNLTTSPRRIAIIGDSISAGLNPDQPTYHTYGWVDMIVGSNPYHSSKSRFKTVNNLWPGATVTNYSISGATAKYFNNSDNLGTIIHYKPDLIILYIGGNDLLIAASDGVVTKHENREIENDINGVIEKLQKNLPKSRILLVNYYDLFDGYSKNIKKTNLKNYYQLSHAMNDLNDTLATIAESYSFPLIDVHDEFLHHCYGRYFGDGKAKEPVYVALPFSSFNTHPNTLGHERIYEHIFSALAAYKDERLQ